MSIPSFCQSGPGSMTVVSCSLCARLRSWRSISRRTSHSMPRRGFRGYMGSVDAISGCAMMSVWCRNPVHGPWRHYLAQNVWLCYAARANFAERGGAAVAFKSRDFTFTDQSVKRRVSKSLSTRRRKGLHCCTDSPPAWAAGLLTQGSIQALQLHV